MRRRTTLAAAVLGGVAGACGIAFGAFSESVTNTSSFAAAADFTPVVRSVPDVLGAPRSPTGASTLEATSGDWYFDPPTFAYQWQRCDAAMTSCSAIVGATAATYTPTNADDGARLRVQVVASNGAAPPSAAHVSEPTDVVKNGLVQGDAPTVTTLPVISGTTTVGQTLTVSRGTWNPDFTTSVTWQWQRCNANGGSCTDIAGATGAAYLLTAADQGLRMRVKSIGRQGLGTSNYTLSADTSIVD